jgi:hypothetical protein
MNKTVVSSSQNSVSLDSEQAVRSGEIVYTRLTLPIELLYPHKPEQEGGHDVLGLQDVSDLVNLFDRTH